MSAWAARRILVAVDDSPAALAATRVAVDLAVETGAHVRFVHVLVDGELVRALTATRPEARLGERRSRSAQSLLDHVVTQAHREGIEADGVSLEGDPARLILDQVRSWGADLIVIGRSDVRGTGRPYVGTVTRHVLEFSDDPVLVVPRPD